MLQLYWFNDSDEDVLLSLQHYVTNDNEAPRAEIPLLCYTL